MANLYLVPKWFVGFDASLEILFAIISFVVAFYSFRLYKISQERSIKLFGISFGLISISYFIWAILNLVVIQELNDGMNGLSLSNIISLSFIGLYLHIILFTIGLATLSYTTLKVKNYRIYLLIALLSILAIAISSNKALAFYTISSFLLLSIVVHYATECKPRKNIKSVFIMLAFAGILASTIILIFATRSYVSYVIAHALELISYLTILASLAATLKHEQEKK